MIFNSLGSNYNYKFVINSLFASNDHKNKEKLVNFLNNKYDGETILLYKGREAIKLALDILKLPKDSEVGITGFTCYAVYKAVVDANCSPTYLDIDKETLNFSLEEVKKHKDLKVVIIQNTLGNPCDIVSIKKYCLDNDIILIEDLAHSIGTIYKSGKEAGSYGDFVVLSFGQDKIIDAVSGGALIIKNNKYKNQIKNYSFQKVSLDRQIKDRVYPLLTFLIRKTYSIGLGKLLHHIFKKTNILSQSVNDNAIKLRELPNWYCHLINLQFVKLKNDLRHRQEIVNVYKNEVLTEKISSNLRFSLIINNRKELIGYLKQFGFHISDIWYDAPIAPVKFLKLTDYSGECPLSEQISKSIVNLPTHLNISVQQAEKLSARINTWLSTQQK